METRKPSQTKASPLPVDYLRMVNEVFTTNFDAGLKAFSKYSPNAFFRTQGEVLSDEVILSLSLMSEGQLAATTVYASSDFDPKASAPTVQDLLSACVDAIGSIMGSVLDPENSEQLERLSDESLSALENVPFEWTIAEFNKRQIFVRVDKANPMIESMADEWLSKNDPELKKKALKEEDEVKNLFVTGPSKKQGSSGGMIQ